MCERFKEKGAIISKVYFSPYHPIHGIGKYKKDDFSRKPNPGMLLDAINDFDLDPKFCILIGDSKTDIHAGLAAKIGTNIYLGSSNVNLDFSLGNIFSINSLDEAIPFL
jgi:D-glycero-D-manno-heptose 1,7-bisphosphate phosphatase